MLEVEEIAHLGTAEAVDALVGVPDDADVAVSPAEKHDDFVLGEVGVLVLVHEDVGKALLVRLEHVDVIPEEPHSPHE